MRLPKRPKKGARIEASDTAAQGIAQFMPETMMWIGIYSWNLTQALVAYAQEAGTPGAVCIAGPVARGYFEPESAEAPEVRRPQ